MWTLFKKKNRPSVVGTLWLQMETAINVRARYWAGYLNGKIARCNRRTLIWILVLFCLYGSMASLFIILQAVRKKGNVVTVTAITVPKPVHSTPMLSKPDTALKLAVTHIERVTLWLDSLHMFHPALYDSLVTARPGLIDSIQFIHQYYSFKK
jgi:hypothetical protein